MKVLFMFGTYKPKPSANGICCDKVMKEFIKNGHSVTCIVNGVQNSSDYEIIDGVNVIRIKPRLTHRLKEWSEGIKSSRCRKLILNVSKVINKLKSISMVAFWPLISPGYTYRFYKNAKIQHNKEKFDIVVSIYTPVDSLIAGHLLKLKYPDLQFVPYFLDSLSGGYGPKYFSKNRLIKNGQKWEKRLLKNADKIIAMKSSEIHHSKNNKQFSYFKNMVFLDIPLVSKIQIPYQNLKISNKSVINFVFMGSIPYPIRNPKYILNVFEKLSNDNINLIFLGDNNCPQMFESAKQVLGNKLTLLNRVPYDDALTIMMEADILINLGNNIGSMVPSKIFEYMSLGKPIISTYSIDNEPSLVYLKKYPSALLLDERNEDFDNVAREIEAFVRLNIKKQIPYDYIESIFELNTPKAFIKEVEKLFNVEN